MSRPRPSGSKPEVKPRSWWGVRWRQLRNPPQPVFRAVIVNTIVAIVGAIGLLAADVVLRSSGSQASGGDPLALLAAGYAIGVVMLGSLLTYAWVRLPSGSSGVRRRSVWSGLLGLFASVPIVYLVLLVTFEVVRPMLR